MKLKVIENPSERDIFKIAFNLRDIDRKEAFLTTGKEPAKTVTQSCLDSSRVWVTKTSADKPVALFGLQVVNREVAIPWMVATEDLKESARDFLRASKLWVEYLQGDFQCLINFCLPENTTSIRWLKLMGFEFDNKPIPYGYFDHHFLMFWRT